MWDSARAVLLQEKKPPNNITLGEQYWEINPADGDREGEGAGGRGGIREEREPRRRTILREGAILYYVPCTNKHGIPPPCGVAHGLFFSRRKNHPTRSRSANNTGKLILRTGTIISERCPVMALPEQGGAKPMQHRKNTERETMRERNRNHIMSQLCPVMELPEQGGTTRTPPPP